jgi:hypothetical protein
MRHTLAATACYHVYLLQFNLHLNLQNRYCNYTYVQAYTKARYRNGDLIDCRHYKRSVCGCTIKTRGSARIGVVHCWPCVPVHVMSCYDCMFFTMRTYLIIAYACICYHTIRAHTRIHAYMHAYIHTCALIWPRNVPCYKDALNLIRNYLNRIDLWMIARTCVYMPTPIAPMSAAQLARFDVASNDYFAFALQANDIDALEWLFARGLFGTYHAWEAIIPMTLDTYDWAKKRDIIVKDPHSFWTTNLEESYPLDATFLCLRKDATLCYHSLAQQFRETLAQHACVLGFPTCMDIVRYHYDPVRYVFNPPYIINTITHPDVADLLQAMHPTALFFNSQKFHTRTAKRIHASYPRTSDRWMLALTWDGDASAFMDTLPVADAYTPRRDEAIQWLQRHNIKFNELDALQFWKNPPMRLFREDLMKNMSMGARKRTCHTAVWHLIQDKVGHQKIRRMLNASCHLPFASEDIVTLCGYADGELMSKLVPVFTKTHLVAALRAGNLPFLRWLVGLACKLGVEYCIKHVKHKRTWVWLRDNVPQRRYLIVSFDDNIDVHLRDQLRADQVTFFRRNR